MPTVVIDTSCMIDLRKAGLLEAMLRLPHRFTMPNTLFEDEFLCLTEKKKNTLRRQGLEVADLSSEQTQKAQQFFNRYSKLNLNDCFALALALAERTADSILMTGDEKLKETASKNGVEAHGILWLIDELEHHAIVGPRILHEALCLLRDDDRVLLPQNEISIRLQRLEAAL